jgi:nucleoside-diphosphate-sugar epimerase
MLTGSLVEPNRGVVPEVPSAPYAAAKCAASEYARMFHTIYKLPVVIARVFMVYGPGQKDKTKLIPYVTRKLLQGEAPMITSGQRLIDWIYIDDVIRGFIDISEASGIEGETIDLGSGHLITIHDIVQLVVKLLGSEIKPLFGALQDRALEPLRKADTASSESRIGWRPTVSLEDGLMQTIGWIRSQHWEGS